MTQREGEEPPRRGLTVVCKEESDGRTPPRVGPEEKAGEVRTDEAERNMIAS